MSATLELAFGDPSVDSFDCIMRSLVALHGFEYSTASKPVGNLAPTPHT
jgi:hypothetical protein